MGLEARDTGKECLSLSLTHTHTSHQLPLSLSLCPTHTLSNTLTHQTTRFLFQHSCLLFLPPTHTCALKQVHGPALFGLIKKSMALRIHHERLPTPVLLDDDTLWSVQSVHTHTERDILIPLLNL